MTCLFDEQGRGGRGKHRRRFFRHGFGTRDECEHFQKGFMGWVKIILLAKIARFIIEATKI
jgi:hypothetical protein